MATPGQSDSNISETTGDNSPLVTIIVPTYNEEHSIGQILNRLEHVFHNISNEIIVSDSSTDRTAEIAEEHGVKVIKPDEASLDSSLRTAFQSAEGRIFLVLIPDPGIHIEDVKGLLDPIQKGKADLAVGSRESISDSIRVTFFDLFLRSLFGIKISDSQSGIFAISRDAIRKLDIDAEGSWMQTQILIDASLKGLSIVEVPVSYEQSEAQSSIFHIHRLKEIPNIVFRNILFSDTLLMIIGSIGALIGFSGLIFESPNFAVATLIWSVLFFILFVRILSKRLGYLLERYGENGV